jgi:hypothetical protein
LTRVINKADASSALMVPLAIVITSLHFDFGLGLFSLKIPALPACRSFDPITFFAIRLHVLFNQVWIG